VEKFYFCDGFQLGVERFEGAKEKKKQNFGEEQSLFFSVPKAVSFFFVLLNFSLGARPIHLLLLTINWFLSRL